MDITLRLLCSIFVIFAVACQKSSDDLHSDPLIQAGSPDPKPSAPANPTPSLEPPSQSQNEERDEVIPTGSAEQVAIPFEQIANLGIGSIPAWPESLERLHKLVQEARDARLYQNPNTGNYLRRAPWYHGDGCYAKAAHVSAFAEKSGFPRPGKVLAFGGWATMRYKSQYLPNGVIWWTYHVVAAYHIQSKVYVLDPLVSPSQALSVDEWVRAIAPRPEKITVSFCDQNLYLPTDQCVGGHQDGAFLGDMRKLLRREYLSLQNAGYDPDTLL